jgi:hypothetical protein
LRVVPVRRPAAAQYEAAQAGVSPDKFKLTSTAKFATLDAKLD